MEESALSTVADKVLVSDDGDAVVSSGGKSKWKRPAGELAVFELLR